MDISTISLPVLDKTYEYEFSICTLVTRREEYAEMMQSFLDNGFDTLSCEYLHINNTEKCQFDAYKGLNLFLDQAKGKYIIICHQDIILHDHDKNQLDQEIRNIDSLDPGWAILANAGGINFKWIATNLTQGSGNRIKEKRLPLQTKTADENFLVIKQSANLALSGNLKGFHMYGTDICLIADILGYRSYIINFNLTHKSDGKVDQSFDDAVNALKKKYKYALRNRFIATTIARIFVSGTTIRYYIYNTDFIKFFVRQYYKFFLHKKRYHLTKQKVRTDD